MGCHIITAPADVLKKLPALGTKSAAELSLGAVKSFREDALAAGLQLVGSRLARRRMMSTATASPAAGFCADSTAVTL